MTSTAIEDESLYNPQGQNLIIACGALAREILWLINAGALNHVALQCLPAKYHNTPADIIPNLQRKIDQLRPQYNKIYIGYADCGTGGLLDKFCAQNGYTRIVGAHCYAFFAGLNQFDQYMEQELGSFFLTDFLCQHFDNLIMEGMGLNKHPQLIPMMFGNYKKLVYLAQTDNDQLDKMGQLHAQKIGLTYQRIYTGYGELAQFVAGV